MTLAGPSCKSIMRSSLTLANNFMTVTKTRLTSLYLNGVQ